ncbi:MAG: type II toxin-antitoxin system HicB family antitoxin [Oscillospiraceae bacterium]|nr:type II toxin-antitoxin system HicB family antitoxin [Oscillospiraceae bacterium]
MNCYHINVFYSPEDEGFIADIPDLRGCSAFGDTPEKAFAEVLIAQKLWLEVAMEDNEEIPVPKYRPMIYQAVMA